MNPTMLDRVKVFVEAYETDQVLSGCDENGSQYSTVILGARYFWKIVDLSPQVVDAQAVNVNIDINGNLYPATAKPRWSDADQEWRLETKLPATDNRPLRDCTGDASWAEIQT